MAQMEQPVSEVSLIEPPKDRMVPNEPTGMSPLVASAQRMTSMETGPLHIPQINVPTERHSPKAASPHVSKID